MAAQGAVAGAIAGGANAAISGGSASDILKGAFVGAVQGAICGGVLHGLADGKGFDNAFLHIAGHGLVGGASNEAMGGRFQDGFVSAAISAGAVSSGFVNGGLVSRTIKCAIVGGTASALGGGKFANGAFTGAFQYLTNEAAAEVRGRLPSVPCIQCHGVSAQGYSGNSNDFQLGTVMSPVMEEGLHAYVDASKETTYITSKAAAVEIVLQTAGAKLFSLLGSAFAAASAPARVFWSGGAEARLAAESFAKANGATTLEMTEAGQRLQQITKGMDWADAKPLWEAASRDFAQGASGPVHVFQNGNRGVSLESIWRNVEYPILKQNGNGIIYNVTTPAGPVRLP